MGDALLLAITAQIQDCLLAFPTVDHASAYTTCAC